MRTNGLSNKQLMQGLIFDFSLKAFLFCILFFAGCRSWKWTDFEFINLCNVKLHIVVSGVNPEISPGNMPPDSNGFGSRAGLHFGDPVNFAEIIKIVWTIEDDATKHEQEFKREDLGIPAVVSGGKITFTYTQTGNWEVKYSK